MRKKKLGRTELEVSIVGLGGANLGLPTQASVAAQHGPENTSRRIYMDEDLGVAAVHAALEGGMTLVDTAPKYGFGMSERIIAKALRERPDLARQVVVTTKVGLVAAGDGFDYSYGAAMRCVQGSQERLGMDHFPLLYLHDPMGFPMDFVMSKNGVMGALRKLRAERAVDYIGVAADNPETAADYIATGEFDVATVSGAWSLINQTAMKRILPLASKWSTGIVATTVVERGLLATGELLPGVTYLQRRFPPELVAHVKKIKSLCDEFGIPLLAAALQWATRHPQVATAIPGARTPEEAGANARAGNIYIPEDFWEKLKPLHWDILTGY